MKIALFGQFYHKNSSQHIQAIITSLQERNVTLLIEENFYNILIKQEPLVAHIHQIDTFTTLDNSYDLFFSMGGDGTILKSITFVGDLNIPIVGINTGRLGFLATLQKEEISNHISAILKGNYTISERTLVSLETEDPVEGLQPLNFALNEIAVNRKNTTSMIKVDTKINNKHLTTYWSDGLIVATPTGSTGYSLSCGGPIIDPKAKSIVLTPISPHNLNARPLVIPDNSELSLTVSGREDFFLVSLDSRIHTIKNNTTLHIKRAPFTIKLVQLLEDSFFNTLREKLLWGEDKRN